MITYTITGDNIPNSEAVRAHIENHYKKFEKFVDPSENHEMVFTLAKTTAHQREDTYRVEVTFKIHSENYFVSADNADLFSAIDEAKDILARDISKNHDRKRTLFHRGARTIKNIARGMMGKK